MKSRITYLHEETNEGKVAQIEAVHAAFVSYVQECATKMVQDRKVSLKLSEYKAYFPTSSILSSHIKKSAQAVASDLVSTWVAGLYGRKLKNHIRKLKLPELEQIQLYFIGKYNITHSGTFGRAVIPQAMVDLYWSWVWDKDIVGNPPTVDPSKLPMKLTEMTCAFGPSTDSSHFGSNWWLRFSSLSKGKRTEVPLKWTPYLGQSTQGMAKTVTVRKDSKGRWVFQFTDKTEEEKDGSQPTRRVGVDVGLNVIAADSKGNLYGAGFKPKFDRLYKKVKDVRANRQRQDLKKDSKRLARLEAKLSGMTKTVTGTVANDLVRNHPETTFVIEDLDLSGCKGQKRFAYRRLHSSLSQKAHVEVVNPAYTSQTCPSCGHVSRNNRRGTAFCCSACGRVSHADFVGALNLLGRSEDKQVGLKTPPNAVKKLLQERSRASRKGSTVSSAGAKRAPEPSGPKLTTPLAGAQLQTEPPRFVCLDPQER